MRVFCVTRCVQNLTMGGKTELVVWDCFPSTATQGTSLSAPEDGTLSKRKKQNCLKPCKHKNYI